MQYARDKWSSLPLVSRADFITNDIRFSCYSLATAGHPWLVVSKQRSPFPYLVDLSCKVELGLHLMPLTRNNFFFFKLYFPLLCVSYVSRYTLESYCSLMDIISRVKVIIDELSHDKKDKICIFDKYMHNHHDRHLFDKFIDENYANVASQIPNSFHGM